MILRCMPAVLLCCTVVSAGQLPRIAITQLSSTSFEPREVLAVSEKLSSLLHGTGMFDVVERRRLEAVLAEQALEQTGAIDETQAVQAGRLLGAEVVVVGSMERAGGATALSLRFVEVATGRTVGSWAEEMEGSLRRLLKSGLAAVVQRIAEAAMPLSVEFTFVAARDDRMFEVDDGDTLHSGDRVHLMVRSPRRCFVYVINRDAAGRIYTLYPNPTQRFQPLEPETDYHIPAEGTSFKLDTTTGNEEVHVIASVQPLADIEELLFAPSEPSEQAVMDRVRLRGFASVATADRREVQLKEAGSHPAQARRLSGLSAFHHQVTFRHAGAQR